MAMLIAWQAFTQHSEDFFPAGHVQPYPSRHGGRFTMGLRWLCLSAPLPNGSFWMSPSTRGFTRV